MEASGFLCRLHWLSLCILAKIEINGYYNQVENVQNAVSCLLAECFIEI